MPSRRNEVYATWVPTRTPAISFVDLHEISFEPDAALLLCSVA
jgi:hypothetical protein